MSIDQDRARIEELIKRSKAGDMTAFGYVPSELAPTHFITEMLPAAAPMPWRHPAYRKCPVRSQQGGTCVANSCSTCMTYNEYVEKNDVISFDAEAWSARIVGKDYGEGAAASPHDVLDDAIKHGVTGVLGSVQGQYYPKAYAWVDYTNPEAIRQAMSTPGQMVTGAIWLLDNFGEGPGGPVVGDGSHSFGGTTFIPDLPDAKPWGLHEITYVAYEEQGVIFQNSWGTWWGDGGFGRLSWDYLAKRSTEMLAITDNADNAGGFVKTYDYGQGSETAIARFDLPERKRPAVYRVLSNGREWIKDPTAAKRLGVKLPPVRVPDTDERWNRPVIGQDAPRNLR